VNRRQPVSLRYVPLVAAALLATGCSVFEEPDAQYGGICVDETTQERVDDERCGDYDDEGHAGNGGFFFMWIDTSSTHTVPARGQKVPATIGGTHGSFRNADREGCARGWRVDAVHPPWRVRCEGWNDGRLRQQVGSGLVTAAVQQYRAKCGAPDCDWVFEGDLTTTEAKAAQHKADHRDARRRWQARCTWDRCDWSTTGSEKWVRAAWERHRTGHRAAAGEREARRAARYRWRGKPNPTQQRILEQVRANSLAAHSTLITVVAANQQFVRWYPSNLSRRDSLWWPALVEAGLVVARPTWLQGGQQTGVWQLTAAGRHLLKGGAS
jgi:hypothetical protein